MGSAIPHHCPAPAGLLADVECSGRQVHDANVVATVLVHGIGTVVTMNLEDFARFDRYVSLVGL
jgi:predicted nucleic acid-binding protein